MNVAIIGAGPSGLALSKQLLDRHVNFTVFERDAEVGGVWNIANKHSVMYDSAHTISSKTLTEFTEFPMPETYTDYISHKDMLRYLKAYAEKFGLLKNIRFDCAVKAIKKIEQDRYQLTTSDDNTRQFSHVVIANGHGSSANIPALTHHDFSGRIFHAAEYKEPSLFKGKKVLVIGAGNSACDIACDAVSTARSVHLSVRRGYYYIPKFFFGMPSDVFGETSVKLRLPMFIRQGINKIMLRIIQGDLQKSGFPKPDHRFFETHPIVNELLVYYTRQGDITICNDVKEISSSGVLFKDGKSLDVDIIVFATGYTPNFEFLEKNLRPENDDLHLNLFSKKHHGLSFLGLIDPNGGILGILESQARLVASSIELNFSAERFLPLIQKTTPLHGGIRYVNSARHRFEVDHATYRREIKKLSHVFDELRNPEFA